MTDPSHVAPSTRTKPRPTNSHHDPPTQQISRRASSQVHCRVRGLLELCASASGLTLDPVRRVLRHVYRLMVHAILMGHVVFSLSRCLGRPTLLAQVDQP